jgi:ribosomal protein L44E
MRERQASDLLWEQRQRERQELRLGLARLDLLQEQRRRERQASDLLWEQRQRERQELRMGLARLDLLQEQR